MVLLTLSNLSNAIKIARKRRAKVRYIGDETFEVRCSHDHRHIVRFEESEMGVFAACDCPSRVACYHLAHANDLRTYMAAEIFPRLNEQHAPQLATRRSPVEMLSDKTPMLHVPSTEDCERVGPVLI